MELPPYRMPTLRGIAIHMWERAWQYVTKAGTVLLAFAIVIWALMKFPALPPERVAVLPEAAVATAQLEYSFAGRIGKAIEPVMRPLGFDWRTNVALVAGFGAKEVVVSTLGTIYSMSGAERNGGDLQAALRADPAFSPLIAYALMVFVLLYTPCLSSVAIIWRESGQMRWPLLTIMYTCTLAWLAAFVVHQFGHLVGLH